ncbi:putative acyl-CoA dehydrogenase [Actinoplanes missouriensis 431]|uniref:Putative acyl-CoA dehydrogenase n=1 Tax=Actinoplanes missouriensis (strain ATCC 14538 / DSM 43046 / CBS 188.64 / JCM 3121 / NBRC 102363 / NCIMB 12654 / NRRL B-3342 / UNCC 431) TaxID=512565 RepID=I0H667_ACTM4|nr:acyl-CoA dehydrogenase family protein [Actinoplanes missouriensis]BAL88504.1 putative acyl-CoA dehydrogenase [Actinoplanes missouriensis 431]
MNFDLDQEHRDLAAAAGEFLAAAGGPAVARAALDGGAPVRPGRAELVKSGYPAITVPESAGGGGGSVLHLAVVAEQAGRVLAGPSLVTYARAAVLLADHPDRLAGLADGSLAVAVADDDGPVLDAAGADTFLALRDGDLVCGPGTVTVRDPIDATRGLGDVALGETVVLARDAEQLWRRGERVGRTVLASEGLGAAARILEIGVEYAKERRTFGRPIGSYQAIKHMLVDVYVAVEQLRSLVWWAAWAADHAPGELPLAAAAAKAAAATTLDQAAEAVIQVHGGIGFTWEHDAHLYWRRAKVDRFLLGDDVAAFDEVARLAMEASS